MESINEDDYDNAVSKIIIGPKKNSYEGHYKDDIVFLIKEIHEKLKDSPATIFPFIESCSRNANLQLYFYKEFLKLNLIIWLLEQPLVQEVVMAAFTERYNS